MAALADERAYHLFGKQGQKGQFFLLGGSEVSWRGALAACDRLCARIDYAEPVCTGGVSMGEMCLRLHVELLTVNQQMCKIDPLHSSLRVTKEFLHRQDPIPYFLLSVASHAHGHTPRGAWPVHSNILVLCTPWEIKSGPCILLTPLPCMAMPPGCLTAPCHLPECSWSGCALAFVACTCSVWMCMCGQPCTSPPMRTALHLATHAHSLAPRHPCAQLCTLAPMHTALHLGTHAHSFAPWHPRARMPAYKSTQVFREEHEDRPSATTAHTCAHAGV